MLSVLVRSVLVRSVLVRSVLVRSVLVRSVLVRSNLIAFLTIMVGSISIVSSVKAQSTEFKDGKKLELESESEFLRIKALIRDKNWQAAATQIATIIDQADNELIQIPGDTFNASSRFVSVKQFANDLISSWRATAPEALELYRDLVAAESQALYKSAVDQSSLSSLQKVATDFFMSRIGDDATNRLAQIYFENGEFTLAARHWDSLIADPEFPAAAIVRYPDSDISSGDLMCRSLAASLLNGEDLQVEKKLARIELTFPKSQVFRQEIFVLESNRFGSRGAQSEY